ncbi:MAG: hypothetical protein P4L99_08130 [Chthoniobacter sp.]|nr:hypothetical protein [Chthoniobacter sp.]
MNSDHFHDARSGKIACLSQAVRRELNEGFADAERMATALAIPSQSNLIEGNRRENFRVGKRCNYAHFRARSTEWR